MTLEYDGWTEIGFDEYRELGFETMYGKVNPRKKTVEAPWPVESLIAQGFLVKGTKVRWIDHNGMDLERDTARVRLGPYKILTVKSCTIGDSSSKYKFEEVSGEYNTVMFEKYEPRPN